MFCFKVDTNVKVVNNFSALSSFLKIYFIYKCQTYYIFESVFCVQKIKKKYFFTLWPRIVDIKACPLILNYI